MQTKQDFPTVVFKRRTVAAELNGGVPMQTLADELKVPLPRVRRWCQNFLGKIQPRRWSTQETQTQVNLLKAVSRRARIQARIARLRTVLKRQQHAKMPGGQQNRSVGFGAIGQQGPMKADKPPLGQEFKRQVVRLIVNGGMGAPVLAQQLKLPLQKVRRWRQKYRGQIQHHAWPPGKKHKVMVRLKRRRGLGGGNRRINRI